MRRPRAGLKGVVASVLLAGVLAPVSASGIDYEPSSLGRMLGHADLIVYGEVVEVGAESFVATVHQRLGNGTAVEPRIELVRYELYDRSGGLACYEPGQPFVWLLSWRRESSVVGSEPRWHVFGAEGEGELPIADGFVYLRQESVGWATGEERTIHGREGRFVSYPLDTFWDAAIGYRRCVAWQPIEEGRTPRPRRVCTDEEWAAFATRSPLHRQLARRLEDPESPHM